MYWVNYFKTIFTYNLYKYMYLCKTSYSFFPLFFTFLNSISSIQCTPFFTKTSAWLFLPSTQKQFKRELGKKKSDEFSGLENEILTCSSGKGNRLPSRLKRHFQLLWITICQIIHFFLLFFIFLILFSLRFLFCSIFFIFYSSIYFLFLLSS